MKSTALCSQPPFTGITSRNASQQHALDIAGPTLLPSSLLITWARFLSSFLSDHDEIVFHSDDGLVFVNTASWKITVSNATCAGNTHTGITFSDHIETTEHSLWLKYDFARSTGHLYCSHELDDTALQNLKMQLEDSIFSSVDSDHTRSSTEAPALTSMDLSVLNHPPKLIDGASLLHDLINSQVSSEKCAVDYLDEHGSHQSITYRELNAHSDAWAQKLVYAFQRNSAGANPTVPVLIPQSLDLYVALLAILKAGGNFCPLNLDAPEERVNFIIKDVSAKVVLTTDSYRSRIPQQNNVEVVTFEFDNEPLQNAQDHRPPDIKARDLAYVLYTSGSTGTPKGVGLSHAAVCQSLLAHDQYIPQFSRFLQFAAPTFDVSIFEIFFPFFRGCTLVACDRATLLYDLPGVINRMEVDAAELTPTVAGTLLRNRAAVPNLRLLLTIGEMLTPHVISEFGAKVAEKSILWGMYGPTECAIHCTSEPAFTPENGTGNIGFPFDTVSAFILSPATDSPNDNAISVLPVGEIGELAIGGFQLAEGYINRPEQTAAAFVDTPQYGRVYRTGDKARFLPNGRIECLGRLNASQVKLRGQRVELGEIEQVALKLPQCRIAIACVISGILVLFCSVAKESTNPPKILKECRRWLPEFMVPGDVVLLDGLPQLPSGKVDRKALERQYEALKDTLPLEDNMDLHVDEPTLQKVLEVCRDVMGREISPSSQLSSAGLDSLSAIRIASALRAAGFNTGAIDVMEAANPRVLSTVIKRAAGTPNERSQQLDVLFKSLRERALQDELLHSMEAEVEEIMPCTPLQEAMLSETAIDSTRYCNWVELEVTDDMKIERIKQGVLELVAKTEMLRTGFIHLQNSAQSFLQVVWKASVRPKVEEVLSFSRSYKLDDPIKLLHPFSIQIQANRVPPRVLLRIPHQIYDGWSMELILQDLGSLLLGKAAVERSVFREVTEYYAALAQQPNLDPSRMYWKKSMENLQTCPLPDFGTSQETPTRTSATSLVLTTTKADIDAVAHMLEIHPQAFFQGALAYLLSTYSGTSDTMVGSVACGRTIPVRAVESIIGPCITTLPLRIAIFHSQTIKAFLRQIHNRNREIIKHSAIPLSQIKRLSGVPLGEPLFNVLLAWQQTTQTKEQMDQLIVQQIDSADYLESKIMIEIDPNSTEMVARATFHPSALSEAQVKLMLLQLDQLSRFFVAHHTKTLASCTNAFTDSLLSLASCDTASFLPELLPRKATNLCSALILDSACKAVIPRGGLGEVVLQVDETIQKYLQEEKDRTGNYFEHERFGRLWRTGLPGRLLPNGSLAFSSWPEQRSHNNEQDTTPETAPHEYRTSNQYSDTEQLIANALADALNISVSTIDRNSSFSKFGLDSIAAISMSKNIAKNIGNSVPIALILRYPTVRDLALQLVSETTSATHASTPKLKDLNAVFTKHDTAQVRTRLKAANLSPSKILPCTPLQEAMLSTLASSKSTNYINRMLFNVEGDISHLRDAWEHVSSRQEILRTCFVPTENTQFTYAQVVVKEWALPWTIKTISEDELDQICEQQVEDFANHMDFSARPPVELVVYSTGSSKYLLFCCHHALYDARAMSILLNEVEHSYRGSRMPHPVTYESFLTEIISTDLVSADRFWSSSLEAFEPTPFPCLTGKSLSWRTGINKKSLLSQRLPFKLEEVSKACRHVSVSLLSAVQASWSKVLVALLGETDICFGNVFSGRTFSIDGLERLASPCFNTLPIRTKLTDQAHNMDLMRDLQTFNADALPFQLTPLRRIQSKFSHEGQRLFDTLFILQQPTKPLDSGIWSLREDIGYMEFPIVCEISQDHQRDCLVLNLHYDHSFLTSHEIDRIFHMYAAALRSCLYNSSSSVMNFANLESRFSSIANSEPRTMSPHPNRLLHSEFEQHAKSSPDAAALSFSWINGSRDVWSFKKLNDCANQIGRMLLDQGIQLEEAVPIYLPKTPLFYASVLGILKAGAAFTPIDPALPTARKQFMLQELGARFVICDHESDLSWYEFAKPLVPASFSRSISTSNIHIRDLHEKNLAYRLYTSGSTGTPKAASVEHQSPLHTVDSSRSIIPWKKESKLLQYAATTFDMCYYDCFMAWSYGFCLVSAEQSLMFNRLSEVILDNRVTLLDLTPSVAKALDPSNVASVDYLYCIGEAMNQDIVNKWTGKCVNSYGPTEAAFCCTIVSVSKDINPNVIGGPFPTAGFAVYPERGDEILPILGVGELHIFGPQVAREYHANPKLTESQFITRDHRRLYKTGDKVRMLSDGSFEFIGRVDDQVKIRGLRVELGEISAIVLGAHECITSATTQIVKDTAGGQDQLVSFIALRAGSTNGAESVRQATRKEATRKLPSYMVPSFFLILDHIPLSTAGKVDRKALRSIWQNSTERSRQDPTLETTNWTTVQSQIRATFSSFAKVPLEKITPDTTIYQIGLDSINAVQIASRLRGQGYDILAEHVLKYPACLSLSEFLEEISTQRMENREPFNFETFESKHVQSILSLGLVERNELSAIWPCTPLQTGLVAKFLQSEAALYFSTFELAMDHGLDSATIAEAWLITCQRHEMLRVGFVTINDPSSPFCMLSYNQLPSQKHLTVIQEPAWDSSQRYKWRYDCAKKVVKSLHQPPWRVVVNDSGGSITAHLALLHAIYDARSLQIILETFSAALKSQTPHPEPQLNSTLSHIMQSSSISARTKRFWKELSSDLFINRFPNLHPLQSNAKGKSLTFSKCSLSLSDLEAGCRRANITLQAAGQAAWTRILSAYIGESNVTFGVVLSGRVSEDANDAAFPCFTTVPMICQNQNDNRELLCAMMTMNANILEHQFTPLSEVQRLVGHPNEPLFDTLFAYQKLPTRQGSVPWTVEAEYAVDDHAVSIELEPLHNGQLQYQLNYSRSLVPEAQAKLLLDQFDALMLQLIQDPDGQAHTLYQSKPSIYAISPPNDPNIDSEVQLLHQFVEKSAQRFPQRIALEFTSAFQESKPITKTWTYDELNKQGNRVANYLVQQGLSPGELVATCFDKCPEAYFAKLGILKAGCAYVALDPTAPKARKTFIINDSGAKAFLSTTILTSDMDKDSTSFFTNMDTLDFNSFPHTHPKLSRLIRPADRSYCLYTSGTTGTPKGCELTHENAVQAMMSFQRLFAGHWDDSSRWLQFASFHFDVSVLEQYWSWSVGIRVVSAPRDLIFEDLQGTIRQLGITHIDLTPSLARIVHPEDVPDLCRGVFITGGEQLKQEILDVWGPKGVIYNGYGPTEATIGCTMYPRVPGDGKPSNIGPQFDNVGSFVLYPNTEIPVLRGAVGELCVSGKLVGKGYLNRPDLTAERFPTLGYFNERVYRTGDLVRLLHDSTFEFLGRSDDQVKLRGQRLEIGEINAVIKQSNPAITDVSTLVMKHEKQEKEQLVSFVVTQSSYRRMQTPKIIMDDTKTIYDIKQECTARFAGYMVPTHIMLLSSIPLSVNNKADGKQLRQIYNDLSLEVLKRVSGSGEDSKPFTTKEIAVRNALLSMAQIATQDISRTSSIFELGLDSISVIGFSRILKEAGFSNAHPSAIMRNPTVGSLAKVLEKSNSSALDPSVLSSKQYIAAVQHKYKSLTARSLGVDAGSIEAIAPCTPLQQGMISRALESNQMMYFNTFEFVLSKPTIVSQVKIAWEKVFGLVQILRTRFVPTDEGYVQAALKNSSLPWTELHVDNGNQLQATKELNLRNWRQLNRETLVKPFEVILIHTKTQSTMIVHLFHGLYDGNSLPKILDLVVQEYEGSADHKASNFQDVLPYGPLKQTDGSKDFFERHLAEATVQRFPRTSEPAADESVFITTIVPVPEHYQNVRQSLHVTDQAIMQACWAVVLQRYLAGSVTLGMVVSGRSLEYAGAEQIIGPLFNTIPFYIHFNASDTWSSLVRACHDFNISALPYQHTPLRDILKWTKRSSSSPLFENLLVFEKQVAQTNKWHSNDLWNLVEDEAHPDYPLALKVLQQENGALQLTFATKCEYFNKSDAMELLDQFQEAFKALLLNHDDLINETTGSIQDSRSKETMKRSEIAHSTTPSRPSYQWNANSRTLRQEIAKTAGISEESLEPTTSIFKIGLDSIDAIRVASRLRKRGLNVPVSVIMQNLTIEKIARHLSHQSSSAPSTKAGNKEVHGLQLQLENYIKGSRSHQGMEAVYPATALQESMLAEMYSSNFQRYFNHDILKLHPDTDIQRLKSAWTIVVNESSILRTSFETVDDPEIDAAYSQIVRQTGKLAWNEYSVSGIEHVHKVPHELQQSAASLGTNARLFQLKLFSTSNERYLVLSLAHALYDGWSLNLLHNRVRGAYEGHSVPERNYSGTIKEILSYNSSAATRFWTDFLFEKADTAFPIQASSQSQKAIVNRKEISSAVSFESLRDFCSKQGITVQALSQTCWAVVLASYTHSLDVTFGAVLSGRDSEFANEVLFPTMNTVAVRSILHGSRKELLRYMQDSITNIRPHQHFPLRKVQAIAGNQGKGLFDTLFIYQRRPKFGQPNTTPLYESVQGESNIEYPIAVEMEGVGNETVWRCACDDRYLDLEATQGLLRRLEHVLNAFVFDPEAPVLQFSDEGTSVCGLSPFQEARRPSQENSTTAAISSNDSTWTETEILVKEVLSSVAHVSQDEVTKEMTLFHLGLDSISAIKVSSLLKKKGLRLGVSEMLRAGTVRKIAQLASRGADTKPHDADNSQAVVRKALENVRFTEALKRSGIESENIDATLSATAGQVYMLSAWHTSGSLLFFPTFRFTLSGNISFERLESAWRDLVRNEPILRTIFLKTDNAVVPFVQVVLKSMKTSILQNENDHTAGQPFVVLRAQKSKDGWDLYLKIHHALYDGVSLPLLMENLQNLCNGRDTATGYQQLAMTQLSASTLSESAYSQRKAFWTSYLRSTPEPTTNLLPQPQTITANRIEVFKPSLLPMTPLRTLARQNNLTLPSLLLATYARAHLSFSTQDPQPQSIIIGIYLANRPLPIPNLVSATIPTVNLVPLRIRCGKDVSLLESAAEIARDLQEVGRMEHVGVGLWEVEAWTGMRVDTFVNFLRLPEGDVAPEDVEVGDEYEGSGDVRIMSDDGILREERARVLELKRAETEDVVEMMRNGSVMGAYQHSLDIEFGIHDDEHLDVGAFCPEDMLDVDRALKLVELVKDEVGELID